MKSLKTVLFNNENRIGKRLIILIIVFSSLITLVLTVFQLVLDYRQQRHDLDSDLEAIEVHVPSITGSVWVLDKAQAEMMLKAFMQMPNIVQANIKIINPKRQWIAGAETLSPRVLTKTFDLTQEVLGHQEVIGTLEIVASLDNIYASVAKHALVFLLSNGLKTFLVAIFMYFVFRRIVTERLELLEQKVSAQGDLLLHASAKDKATIDCAMTDGDELDSVGRVFDCMTNKMHFLVDELRHSNADLRQENCERRLAEEALRASEKSLETRVAERTDDLAKQMARVESLMRELQQRKDEAELANIAKTRFLSSASHDLRQPMHAIGLLVGVLKERIAHPDAYKIVKDIQTVVETMERLFSALLDISRLDAGIVHPNVCTFPLSNILWAVEKDLSVLAKDKNLQLRVVATSVWVRSDPQILERIVRNLVSNAIRYTPEGKVLLGCRRCGKDSRQVRLEVRDTGIGIHETDIPRIFMEFIQLGDAEQDRAKGLGLGLSIVKRSAELLGHPLNVKSIPGKGSCFSIDLPRAIEHEHKAAVSDNDADAPDLSGTFVVFIDDDKEIRSAMGALLNLWNCHAILSASADEAVEALQEHLRTPDVIVSDYWLADGKDGVGAIAMLRQVTGEETPALIVTGDITPADLARIDSVNLSLIHKPINPHRLGEAIAQAIAANKASA